MKNSISFFILILLKFTAYTQQIPQFTQYMYNTIAINPAFAGAKKVFDINILKIKIHFYRKSKTISH